jgi:hypothetical protein
MKIEQEIENNAHGNNYRKRGCIEYSCGCRYLFDRRRIALKYVCPEHEIELISFHG